MNCRRISCLRALANAAAGCDPYGSRAADVRARRRYPIVHAAGALAAAVSADEFELWLCAKPSNACGETLFARGNALGTG